MLTITALLFVFAFVLFVIAGFGENGGRLIPFGLACLTAALAMGTWFSRQ